MPNPFAALGGGGGGGGPVVNTDLGPKAAGPTEQPNPLAIMSTFADIRNKTNQARQFQQEWDAHQNAGSIIASSPDMATAATRMALDPTVAAWAPDLITKAYTNQNIMTQTQGMRLEQSNSALEGVLKTVGVSAAHPDKFEDTWKVATAGIPKDVASRPETQSALKTMHDVLGTMAKGDPGLYQQYVTGLMMKSGIDPARAFGVSGEAPPAVSISPVTGAQTITGGPITGGVYGEPGVSVPSARVKVAPAPTTGPLITTPEGATPSEKLGTKGNRPADFGPDPSLVPQYRTDAQGFPKIPPGEAETAAALRKEFFAEMPQYAQASQNIARLQTIKDLAQNVNAEPGWLNTGPGGQFKANVASIINEAHSMLYPGSKPPIDVTKVSSLIGLMKESNTLAMNMTNQFMGGSHQAYATLHTALSAVPNIENSPLGLAMVADMLAAGAEWKVGQMEYKQDWLNKSNGKNLDGADAAYITQHPPEELLQEVMSKYGISKDGNGFADKDSMMKAYNSGLINGKMGADEALKKGWMTKEQYKAAEKAGFLDINGNKYDESGGG